MDPSPLMLKPFNCRSHCLSFQLQFIKTTIGQTIYLVITIINIIMILLRSKRRDKIKLSTVINYHNFYFSAKKRRRKIKKETSRDIFMSKYKNGGNLYREDVILN